MTDVEKQLVAIGLDAVRTSLMHGRSLRLRAVNGDGMMQVKYGRAKLLEIMREWKDGLERNEK